MLEVHRYHLADNLLQGKSERRFPPKRVSSSKERGSELSKTEGAPGREEGEAEAWFDRGNEQFDAGDFEGAIASYDKALEIKPDNDAAWFNRGLALHNLGRFSDAITSYDKALLIQPDKHKPWYNRGVTLGKLGRFGEEIASYDKALLIKPDKHEPWYNRGVALGNNLGRFEEASPGVRQSDALRVS
ncbi:tetratricopeptide repeat protein [Brasilonema sp. UFV-L1]|uniref:tetratricopeptide repeat protein n=1 Tax=Brasilonema sp. UFV-L1 TaxID=2234130 RepID=UPI001B7D2634|nr:tetratricopeptide repeat protein [Brasilonema sp. UFV-L1]